MSLLVFRQADNTTGNRSGIDNTPLNNSVLFYKAIVSHLYRDDKPLRFVLLRKNQRPGIARPLYPFVMTLCVDQHSLKPHEWHFLQPSSNVIAAFWHSGQISPVFDGSWCAGAEATATCCITAWAATVGWATLPPLL